jgi:hypothetical protein
MDRCRDDSRRHPQAARREASRYATLGVLGARCHGCSDDRHPVPSRTRLTADDRQVHAPRAGGSGRCGSPVRWPRLVARAWQALTRPTKTGRFPAEIEWSNGGSNPGPPHCERGALPAELLPRMRSLGFAWPSGPIGSATAAEHTPGPIEVKHAYGRLPTLFQRYPDTSERARSPHPFVATNSSSLNGRLTCVGLIICMPSASNMFDTTRSMTRNGK